MSDKIFAKKAAWTTERKAAASKARLGKAKNRKDSERAQAFVSELLLPVLRNIGQAQKCAGQVPASPSALVRFARSNANGRWFMSLSIEALGKQYGSTAVEIWKKLFKCIQRGGFSKTLNRGFDSSWVCNEEARFILCAQGLTAGRPLKPSEILRLLADTPALCAHYTAYKVVQGEDGRQHVAPAGRKRLLDHSEATSAKARRKELLSVVRAEEALREKLHEYAEWKQVTLFD